MKLPTSLERIAQAFTIALSWGYVCLAVPYAAEPVAVRWTVWYFQPPNEAYSLEAILATNLLGAALALILAVLVVGRLSERARQVVGAALAVLSAALCVFYIASGMLLGQMSALVFGIVLGLSAVYWTRTKR